MVLPPSDVLTTPMLAQGHEPSHEGPTTLKLEEPVFGLVLRWMCGFWSTRLGVRGGRAVAWGGCLVGAGGSGPAGVWVDALEGATLSAVRGGWPPPGVWVSAVSYSPTLSRAQYHWRWWA